MMPDTLTNPPWLQNVESIKYQMSMKLSGATFMSVQTSAGIFCRVEVLTLTAKYPFASCYWQVYLVESFLYRGTSILIFWYSLDSEISRLLKTFLPGRTDRKIARTMHEVGSYTCESLILVVAASQ